MLVMGKVSAIEKIAKISLKEIPANLRSALVPRADELFALNSDFVNIKASIPIVNFFEQKETKYLGDLVGIIKTNLDLKACTNFTIGCG